MDELHVYNKSYVGKCYWVEKRSRITSVFSYDNEYISSSNNWNIDPALTLFAGAQPTGSGLPNAFRDAAPDRWGQTLIRHRHIRQSKERGKSPDTLNDVDYLLGVSDFTRQGDLRFSREKDGIFEHPSGEIPKLIALPKLLNAAHRYAVKSDEEAIAYLLDAGSASLGGARPKAVVMDCDDLFIAKFPHRQDKWDVITWEWVCLNAAKKAGIRVPENRLISIDGENVLLVKRFDRDGGERIGYISAMTLLGLTDGERADYFEIAEKLRDVSVSTNEDLPELFRRVVFSIYVNNTDDHLRNHGLQRFGSGWRLSPAFDINPNPSPTEMRATSVFGEVESQASLAAIQENSQVFGLSTHEAGIVISEVALAVKSIEPLAKQTGISREERAYMLSSIFP